MTNCIHFDYKENNYVFMLQLIPISIHTPLNTCHLHDYMSTCDIKYVNFIASYVQYVYYAQTILKHSNKHLCDFVTIVQYILRSLKNTQLINYCL
jgi:hypothetical protein